MNIGFYKYQGTGNDFILIDNRKGKIKLTQKQVSYMCDRRWGIGADGLMLLQNKKGFDFEMKYYNANGSESTFCGNGSRCIVSFAQKIKIIKKQETKFLASDGIHFATIVSSIKNKCRVKVKMQDVDQIEIGNLRTIINNNTSPYYLVNTGSPHLINFTTQIKEINIIPLAKQIRYSNLFIKKGINVNFVEKTTQGIYVRTYERGVEDETLSCGTGVTAAALTSAMLKITTSQKKCIVETVGGKIIVHFKKEQNNSFSQIWLEGDATFVYQGQIEI